ncbi:MAG: type II toxin-antitoxin system mRNA interferase toxin, RelE/StbE family [Stenotrophobium sp.]
MNIERRKTFASDLRRRRLTPRDKAVLFDFLNDLTTDPLPAHYREHPLRDVWEGYLECHLDDDWLAIYKRTAGGIIPWVM